MSNTYFLISHIFAVVLRRIAVFLLSNVFTYYHCKHPRIREVTMVSCPFIFRFILKHVNVHNTFTFFTLCSKNYDLFWFHRTLVFNFLYIFIHEVRLNGVRASHSIVHIQNSTKCYVRSFNPDSFLE